MPNISSAKRITVSFRQRASQARQTHRVRIELKFKYTHTKLYMICYLLLFSLKISLNGSLVEEGFVGASNSRKRVCHPRLY